jgi:thiamin-phosphate kinase
MPVKNNPEITSLKAWLPAFKRWSRQMNVLNSSDAETFRADGSTWASSIDTLNEEITWGLYRQPETIGWIAALQSLTDVAATGILPKAVLLSTTWKPNTPKNFKRTVMKTYFQVLKSHHVHFLGGDTASGRDIQLTTTALGWTKKRPLNRLGLKPGDLILALGEQGSGPALGLRSVFEWPEIFFPESNFRPKPRLDRIATMRSKLRCAIDNSDGLASSLCILSELNGVSFDIAWSKTFFNRSSKTFCQKAHLPESSLFFAEHGDYDFLVGIAPENYSEFKRRWPKCQPIAAVTPGKKPSRILNLENEWQAIPLDFVFNAPKDNPKAVRVVLNNWSKLSKKLNLP